MLQPNLSLTGLPESAMMSVSVVAEGCLQQKTIFCVNPSCWPSIVTTERQHKNKLWPQTGICQTADMHDIVSV